MGDGDDEDGQLLLTQDGERRSSNGSRRVRFSHNNLFDDNTGDNNDSEAEGDEEEDEDEDSSCPDPDEVAAELEDLRALTEEENRNGAANEGDDDRDRFHTPNEEPEVPANEPVDDHQREDFVPAMRTRSSQQPRLKARTSGRESFADRSRSSDKEDAAKEAPARSPVNLLDPDLQDKITAVRFAFPQVSASACGELLSKHDKDVSKAWKSLAKSLKPRQGLAETMVMATQLGLPREVMIVTSPTTAPAGALGEVSHIDEVEDDESSSSDNDESDSSDETSNTDPRDHAPEADGESDSGGDSTPEEHIVPSPGAAHRGQKTDSSDSSGDSSSESQRAIRVPSRRIAKQSRARNPSGNQPKQHERNTDPHMDLSSDGSSESEDSEPQQMIRRRGRKIITSSPPKSSAAKASTRDERSSDSDSDDESSSEDSSSDSSTDSSSESEDEPKQAPAKPSSSSAPHMSARTTVPPGQGLTRTQKRNQRRRLHAQKQKEALAGNISSQGVQHIVSAETGLAAKKAALLHALGTDALGQENEPTADQGVRASAGNNQTFRATAAEDPDAWKQKISYRAVEVVQEGVELSEPPFPFVQRWDPQQRWDSHRNSHRAGKRKSRGDFQFYDESGAESAKKRKFPQTKNDYSYQEEDIILDYDDVSFNPDEGPVSNGYTDRAPELHRSETGDQRDVDDEDLPPLPEDISSLPELRLADVKAGAVIVYKQLLCTEATNWQPQLSDFVTAAITHTYEHDSQEFQVQLAKRDRNVDRNEKKYDEETGQRIYGKFEAPDEDEDGEEGDEDDGFRDVSLSQMIEPRIVQHATGADGEIPADVQDFAVLEARQLAQHDLEVADSQPEEGRRAAKSSRRHRTKLNTSGMPNQETGDGHDLGPDSEASSALDVDSPENGAAMDESFVPETNRDLNGDAVSPMEKDSISITEDRRGEISQLIADGGFRQEVRSSIEQSSFLHLGGSPSRQLEEEMEASVLLSHQRGLPRLSPSSDEAPSEYGSKEPTQLQETSQPAGLNNTDKFHSAPQTPSGRGSGPKTSDVDGAARQLSSTGNVSYPKLFPSQTSQATETSEQSAGRQPDPDFISHSDDMGIELPADSPFAANGFEDNTAIADDHSTKGREQTPPQQVHNDDLPNAKTTPMRITPSKSTQINPPGSAGSTGSSSVFTDIELLGSQPVRNKRRGFSPEIKDEAASSNSAVVDGSTSSTKDRGASKEDEHLSSPSRAQRNVKPSEQGKENDVEGLEPSISPPSLSGLRQEPDVALLSASSSHDNSSGDPFSLPGSVDSKAEAPATDGATKKVKRLTFTIPQGSQVISLLSSPAPESDHEVGDELFESEAEPEPVYTEMYADESVDSDYHDASFAKASPETRSQRSSTSRRKRGASLPSVEKEKASPNWVSGSQGPSRKASGRFGGRFSTGGL